MTSVTQYELLSLINPDLSDEELNGLLDQLRGVIRDAGGEITTEELWGKRRLAYDVLKFREGIYNYTVFHGGPDIPRLLQEFANTEARLLRHLCTVVPKRKLLEDERRARVEAERARREEEEARRAAEAEAARKAAEAAAAAAAVPVGAGEETSTPLDVAGEGAAKVTPVHDEAQGEPAAEEQTLAEPEALTAPVEEGAPETPESPGEEAPSTPVDEERKETSPPD